MWTRGLVDENGHFSFASSANRCQPRKNALADPSRSNPNTSPGT